MIGERPLKTAIVRKLNTEFDVRSIPGITDIPPIIQDRPIAGLPEPYIYVEIAPGQVREVDVRKDKSSYEYRVNVQVVTKSQTDQDSKEQRDLIVSEIQNVLDSDNSDFIDLSVSGYNVYVQNVIRIQPGETLGMGADYFFSTVVMSVRMEFIGLPQELQPVQEVEYTYNGWEFAPINRRIEQYDSGEIIPADNYPDNNNGWHFLNVTHAVGSGADGTFVNGVYNVPNTSETVSLDSTLNYEFSGDSSITTTIQNTDSWDIIRSFRYGSIPASGGSQPTVTDSTTPTYGLRTLSQWVDESHRVIDFENTNPIGDTITIEGRQGEYLYLIVDSAVNINSLVDQFLGENITFFDESVVGDYRVLIQKRPLTYDNASFTWTIG